MTTLDEYKLGPGVPDTRTLREIGEIVGKGRSSYTIWKAWKGGFPI